MKKAMSSLTTSQPETRQIICAISRFKVKVRCALKKQAHLKTNPKDRSNRG